MWESRVLCEISKLLWESFCDFHRSVISIAARFWFFVTAFRQRENGGGSPLPHVPIVVPTASYAVESEADRSSSPDLTITNRMIAVSASDSFSPSW